MKFVHLSDLHLGKRVNEFSMREDQKYILKEILTIIKDEKPDGVLVAGDVFDHPTPSEEAIQMWDEFLVSLSDKKIPVYVISGNHDSAVRLSDHRTFIEAKGVYISPAYDGTVKMYPLEDEYGKLNIYMLPFIKPFMVRSALSSEEEIKTYTDACRAAIKQMNVDSSERNILICHQFVTGAKTCESEEISVGGLDNVDAAVFDEFDYVALGHLHGKQSVGRETIRYCGTPLKYSFSEKDHKKSLTVVEMGEKGDVKISEIPLVPMHDLREIRGSFEELTSKESYDGTDTSDYIHAVLTDEDDVVDALAKLRVIYPNIMRLSYDNQRTRTHQTVRGAMDVETKSPLELFEDFFELQNNQKMSDEQRDLAIDLIQKIWG